MIFVSSFFLSKWQTVDQPVVGAEGGAVGLAGEWGAGDGEAGVGVGVEERRKKRR